MGGIEAIRRTMAQYLNYSQSENKPILFYNIQFLIFYNFLNIFFMSYIFGQ